MADLKPCPFCGGDSVDAYKRPGADHRERWEVACYDCETRGPSVLSRDEAIAAWNRRPEDAPVETGLERAALECIETFGGGDVYHDRSTTGLVDGLRWVASHADEQGNRRHEPEPGDLPHHWTWDGNAAVYDYGRLRRRVEVDDDDDVVITEAWCAGTEAYEETTHYVPVAVIRAVLARHEREVGR